MLRTAARPPWMRAGAFMVPLLTDEWCDPDEGRCRLVIDAAEFGDRGKEGQRGLDADPLDGLEQTLIALQVGALTHQRQHALMYLFVFSPEHLKMGRDGLAQFSKPHRAEPASLGMDHVLELVAAACEFRKRFADSIFRQFDMTGLAAAHLVGGGGIRRQQPGIGGVGLGFGADQGAIGCKARRMDDLDGKLRLTQRLHQRLLIAAGGFDNDARHIRLSLQPPDQRGNGIGAICVMGAIAPMPGDIQARAANVDTDECIVR